jgi:hypothetical protein
MGNEIIPSPKEGRSFEELRRLNQHGAEYWSARDLQPLLGYSQWRRFEEAVQRAITSCQQSGNDPTYHFAGVGKLIEHGKGGKREIPDFHLSCFTCYFIAPNGTPPRLSRHTVQAANLRKNRCESPPCLSQPFKTTITHPLPSNDGIAVAKQRPLRQQEKKGNLA